MVSIKLILTFICLVISTAFAQEKCDAQINSFRECRLQLRQSTNDAFATKAQQAQSRVDQEKYYSQVQACFTNYGCSFTADSIAQLEDYNTCTSQMRTGAREYLQQCVIKKSGQKDFIMPLSRSASKIKEIGSHELATALQYCQISSGVSRRDLLKCINNGVSTTTPPPFFSLAFFKNTFDKASSLLQSAKLFEGKSLNMETANELYAEFCKKQATCEAKVSETCNGAVCGCIEAFNKNKDLELLFRGCLGDEAEKKGKSNSLTIDLALVQNSIKTMRREMPQFCPGASDDYSYTDDEENANKLCNTNCFANVLYGDKVPTTCDVKTTSAAPAGPPTTTPSIFGFFGKILGATSAPTVSSGSSLLNFFNKAGGFNFGG